MFEIDINNETQDEILHLKISFEHTNTGNPEVLNGTTCYITSDKEINVGDTYLHNRDNYCKEFGRKLALKRAMESLGLTREQRKLVWNKYFEVRGKIS